MTNIYKCSNSCCIGVFDKDPGGSCPLCTLAGRGNYSCVAHEVTKLELIKPAPPVDRTKTTLTDGSPVTPDHREVLNSGQQKAYVVLSEEERRRGFVRPVRRSYIHEPCGGRTTMGIALAETYARDPGFYSGTFCCVCGGHFAVGSAGQFVWDGTTEKVGA